MRLINNEDGLQIAIRIFKFLDYFMQRWHGNEDIITREPMVSELLKLNTEMVHTDVTKIVYK